MKTQVCNNTCRKALTAKIRKREVELAEELEFFEKKKHDRKCQVCGVPCFPNYFFCHLHQREEPY
jgi:hypothetical protein